MAVPAWIVQWSFAQNGNAGNTEDLGNDMVNTGDTTDKEQADAAWQQDGSAWICGLAALTIAAVLLFFACAYCVLIKLCGASEKLHDLALRHILQAPVELLHDMPHGEERERDTYMPFISHRSMRSRDTRLLLIYAIYFSSINAIS